MRNFEEEMDVVVGALQMAELTLQALPDDSIYELEKTVEAADDMAFSDGSSNRSLMLQPSG